MARLWLLIALCIVCAQAYADKKVYRWKDQNGNWVYSDTPRKGAINMCINSLSNLIVKELTSTR